MITLVDLSRMNVHQEINNEKTVYSLTQFKNDIKYLIFSLANGMIKIYILKENKYEQFQILEKPIYIRRGEINKVITLSDGKLATAERGVISIWRPIGENSEKKFEFYKEIETYNDTCQLLEINPRVFACAIYKSKLIKVFKKSEGEYSLLGEISNVESHGEDSNGMAKINDKLFCSGGKNGFIYIVSVEPIRIIQKIRLSEYSYVKFLHNSNDGFIFAGIDDNIIQFKIIYDKNENFVNLEKFDKIKHGENSKAITTTNDGKIFYKKNIENYNEKSIFILKDYKHYYDFQLKINKYINY